MKKIIRVISRPTEKSELTRVEFTDGKTTWFGDLTTEELQKHDLKCRLIAQGAHEDVLEELCSLCYSMGHEDGLDEGSVHDASW